MNVLPRNAGVLTAVIQKEENMKLHDVIESIETFPVDATIFVERINEAFLPESEVELFELTDEEMTKPIKEVAAIRAPGKEYFLEVFVAKEAIEGWQEYRGGDEVSASEITDVVIFYAENDAWPMTDEDNKRQDRPEAGQAYDVRLRERR